MSAGECSGEGGPTAQAPREDQAAPRGVRALLGTHTAACSGTGCPPLLSKINRTLMTSVISPEIILWLDVAKAIFTSFVANYPDVHHKNRAK